MESRKPPMIVSMTGYGRGEAQNRHYAVALEAKSVNHRHFEALIKLPNGLWELEKPIKDRLREVIHRGRVEVFLHLLSPVAGSREPIVDVGLAAKYLDGLQQAGKHLKLTLPKPDWTILVRLPDVIRVEDRPIQTEFIQHLVMQALSQALKRLSAMRRTEGRKLASDIRRRLQHLRQLRYRIQRVFQHSQHAMEKRLKQRMAQWLKTAENAEGKDLCSKLLRTDITEELVRLDSHLSQFSSFMLKSEPVGRRLDFLLQEINREINTIGSKAADARVAQDVVLAKEELEKIREQVQNLE